MFRRTPMADSNVNLGNPPLIDRPGTPFPASRDDHKANTVAAYVNDRLDLTAQWKLVAGLRWDRFEARATAVTSLATVPARTTLSPGADRMLSTRGGVIYQPSEAQSYYASFGTSFNPTAETLTISAANAGLDPEENTSCELGAKWDLLRGDLAVNAALFRVEKTNMRTTDPVDARLNVLDGKARVQGLELGIAGRVLPQWQVFGGYTWLDGKVLQTNTVGTGLDLGLRQEGKALQNTPRHSATRWSTYEPGGGWELGGGVLYSAERWLNNFETAKIDGYTRFDATVAYRQKDYDLRLSLLNLGDKLYYETASVSRASPATGRQLRVTASYRF